MAAKTNHTPASRAHQQRPRGLEPEAEIPALSPVSTFHSPGILQEHCGLGLATRLLPLAFLSGNCSCLKGSSTPTTNPLVFSLLISQILICALPEAQILEDCPPSSPSLCWVHTHCLHLVSMELPPTPGEGPAASHPALLLVPIPVHS